MRGLFTANPHVSQTNVNFGIPSRMSVVKFANNRHGEDAWRVKVHDFIGQKWFQATLTILLVLDVIIVFTEVLLDKQYPPCYTITRDCIACCPVTEIEGDQSERWLADDDYNFCENPEYKATGDPACDEYRHKAAKMAKEVLFWMTVVILSFFAIEILTEMAVLGIRVFFKQVFLALDFVVVFASLTLEIAFHYLKKTDFEEIAAMLVVVRLWRFIRIGHGIVEVTSEQTSESYEPLFHYIEDLEEKLRTNAIQMPEKEEKVKKLIEAHAGHY